MIGRFAAALALVCASALAPVTAHAEPVEEPGFSYCWGKVGTGSNVRHYITRVMPDRVYGTTNTYGRYPDYAGPNKEWDVRTRLAKDLNQFLGSEITVASTECDAWPRQKSAAEYRLEHIQYRLREGIPVFEFDWKVGGMPITTMTPVTAPSPSTEAAPKSAPPGAAAIVLAPSETPAQKKARIASEDRREAERLAAKKRAQAKQAEKARREAAAKVAADASKQNKPPPCGGRGERACGATRQ